MTVSYFEALEDQIPVIEARAMLAAAQVAVYPHAPKDSAERMWRGWMDAAHPPRVEERHAAERALFTLGGRPVSFEELRDGLGAAMAPGGLSA